MDANAKTRQATDVVQELLNETVGISGAEDIGDNEIWVDIYGLGSFILSVRKAD